MQTNFSLAQLADPQTARSEQVLRACVHCGFCTATCPTYVLLGDELDSPRGRIYLIKDMLENDRPATVEVAKHIDRCLSCLSCMTTCPSGVHYMHLVDHARDHVEKTYRRPLMDRLTRALLAHVLPSRRLFRLAIGGAMLARPFAGLFAAVPGMKPIAAMLRLAPARPATRSADESVRRFAATGPRRARVALLDGCAQPVLRPAIDEAAIRLMTRMGVEIVRPVGGGCCGSLTHHMGKEDLALANARANVDAWWREIEGEGLDAIIVTTSGCGTTIKDYGHMLRTEPAYAERAARVSALAKDVSEFLAGHELPAPVIAPGIRVAYHSACSLQHGQRVRTPPKALLAKAGFTVLEPAEGHLCCGSAGTYNILQPEIAERLRARKVANIERTDPQVVAAGNIGCMTQIGGGTALPVVHTVELLDWATGGPMPAGLEGLRAAA
ncbi:glycolate oxidase subunit GlcF [Ancylobacter dichloromethanicus]|uniref:Glycolate oxidase iron-sulfur subunit n=1 Tax=Ancylobacter dichloromethanicus TaxID=518825 RepID=A0A9W6J8M3_9HYPH|nr:glycolate oxidase subunit GlcF [Ancylobacter dichloromethanicus]MBS7556554.1 glycolate oxidase subunit GlcF [Ancylobacter dichloromethanicus]GLK71856.1 glycolate oxidase iron-sulfur subunit [Ancylobacter dichloromethanicus]